MSGDRLDDALRQLLIQLRESGYRDRVGQPVELNLAYRNACALLGVDPGRPPPRGAPADPNRPPDPPAELKDTA